MLSDYEQLANLLQRFARAADERDIDGLRSMCSPDARLDHGRGPRTVDEFLEIASAPTRFQASMHLVGVPLIDLDDSAGAATVDSYAVAYLVADPASDERDETLGIRYLDRAVRAGPGWVLSERVSTTMWTR